MISGRLRFMFGAAIVGVAVLLGACTSNSPNSISTTTTTTTSGSSSSSSSTSTTTALPTCSTGTLAITATPGGAAAGTSYYTFNVVNNGPSTCSLEGFPKLEFFGPSGAGGAGAGPKLDISVVPASMTPALVRLAQAATAQFLLFVHEVPSNGVGCDTVASVDVTPPGGNEALSLPVTFNACGGSVTVDPLAANGTENP